MSYITCCKIAITYLYFKAANQLAYIIVTCFFLIIFPVAVYCHNKDIHNNSVISCEYSVRCYQYKIQHDLVAITKFIVAGDLVKQELKFFWHVV